MWKNKFPSSVFSSASHFLIDCYSLAVASLRWSSPLCSQWRGGQLPPELDGGAETKWRMFSGHVDVKTIRRLFQVGWCEQVPSSRSVIDSPEWTQDEWLGLFLALRLVFVESRQLFFELLTLQMQIFLWGVRKKTTRIWSFHENQFFYPPFYLCLSSVPWLFWADAARPPNDTWTDDTSSIPSSSSSSPSSSSLLSS